VGDPAQQVTVSLLGAEEVRLLVTRDSTATPGAYANWIEPSLFEPFLTVGDVPRPGAGVSSAHTTGASTSEGAERDLLARLAADEVRYLLESVGRQSRVVAESSDSARQRHVLANEDLAIIFDAGGPEPNSFTVLDRGPGKILLHHASLRIDLDARTIEIADQASVDAGGVRFRDADHQGFGRGRSMTIRLHVRPDDLVTVLRFTLFPDSRVMLLEADVPGATPTQRIDYAFFARAAEPTFVGAARAELLSDYTRLRHTKLTDDGLLREIAVDFGKPVVLWGPELSGAVIMAPLDETQRVPWIAATPASQSVRAALAYVVSSKPHQTASPRLFLEIRPSRDLREAAVTYQRYLNAAQPQPPLPSWVRFQWSTWYPFEMEINQDILTAQADLLQRHFADLGPWHIVLDAGWYVAEGRPGSGLRAVDRAKFPRGLRASVDSIHSKGMKLIIYLTTPYVDSRSRQGDWAALRGIIDEHPEWLIPLGPSGSARGYVFDYAHSGLRAYMHGLFDDVLRRFDSDGLLVDGLGSGPENFRLRRFVDRFGSVTPAVEQTTEIYRFNWQSAHQVKRDIYVEGGVHNPAFARPYAHTFRLADDAPSFSAPDPASGLVEHIDYATYQKLILGQRPNMGTATDEEAASSINVGWLQAGIALDSQVTLGFDLNRLSTAGIEEYRALLNHYRPFTGTTRVDQVLEPSTFVTVKDNVAYLGLLNRAFEERRVAVALDQYGLRSDRGYTVFDTTSRQASTVRGVFETAIGPQAFRLFILANQPTVVWTTSSFATTVAPGRLAIRLDGPAHVAGLAKIVVPQPRHVTVDGIPIAENTTTEANFQYRYDPTTRLMTVTYPHGRPFELAVEF
jgi:hypothetical protein